MSPAVAASRSVAGTFQRPEGSSCSVQDRCRSVKQKPGSSSCIAQELCRSTIEARSSRPRIVNAGAFGTSSSCARACYARERAKLNGDDKGT